MSNNTNTAATPKQNLNNIVSHFSTFVIALTGKPKHAQFNTIFQSLETWSKGNNSNRAYNAHEESNLSKLWTEYFQPIPEEENDISLSRFLQSRNPEWTCTMERERGRGRG
ncbi:hypothetical protein B0T09DRAFT_360657 [Sordaria sp. MPI-SDFR-AT-0083]|nr:hypothetical protein B0T09DRAFT_360657 [Sordaria sp. MPI-SDFR-AT-0083]